MTDIDDEERTLTRNTHPHNPFRPSRTNRMLIGMVEQGMEARGMNGRELSTLTGLSAPYISQLLRGRRPGKMEVWDLMLDAVHSDYFGLGAYRIDGPKPGRTKVKRHRAKPVYDNPPEDVIEEPSPDSLAGADSIHGGFDEL